MLKKTDDTELEKKGKILKKCNDKLENYKKRKTIIKKLKKNFLK